ncbi:MAG: hypothetical protein IJ489_04965 [Clostridia bacterium]|nr:hypothetical protein [Clostridia bacterium]
MEIQTKSIFGLTGNQLKIIALLAMTIDHIGYQLLPQYTWMRIIGRLAFPIFAYMIAEGARYTKNRKKYLGMMLGLGAICQLVYFFAMDSLYQCILITFSLSIILIYALDNAFKRRSADAWILFALIFIAIFILVYILPELLTNTDYNVDYGIWGVLSPVFVYLGGKNKWAKLGLFAIPLIFLSLSYTSQWYCLFTLILLAFYNGSRGKLKMKYLFYIYYPAHLVIIYAIGLFL